jgi:type IV secretion system protein VirB9
MKYILNVICVSLFFCVFGFSKNFDNFNLKPANYGASDIRIKKYIYNPDEVYLVILHDGFQTTIEFEDGETIDTMSMGEAAAWTITPVNHRLFIKPLEKNVKTNMVVITNRRIYNFDLVSAEFTEDTEPDSLVYQVRFLYPSTQK